jgi:hypothetical protein
VPDACEIPNCKKEAYISFCGKWICKDDWEKYDREKLKEKLGIKENENANRE